MGSIKQVLWNLAIITLGSSLCAVAINAILIAHRFVSGGVVGLALVIPRKLHGPFVPDLDEVVLVILKDLCLLFNDFLGLA